AWLVEELKAAPADRPLLLALHHPVISLDNHHSGSTVMHEVVDGAVQDAGRLPDVVLTAHVHNYQRFTRQWSDAQVPFIVAGAGGAARARARRRVGDRLAGTRRRARPAAAAQAAAGRAAVRPWRADHQRPGLDRPGRVALAGRGDALADGKPGRRRGHDARDA